MPDWLEPVQSVLDRAERPVRIFFRDDDGGWDDRRLFALLDVFAEHGTPLDVALIPTALSDQLLEGLAERFRQRRAKLGLHQHGYAHANHEPEGRKCEFGASRALTNLWHDIVKGRERLQSALGSGIDPIFTPPWNRCSQLTVDCLNRLGFKILSRNAGARPLELQQLAEMPVHIDWCRLRERQEFTWLSLGESIARNFSGPEPTGIMLHHAVMDVLDRKRVGELLALVAGHRRAECRLIRDLAQGR